MQSKRRSSKGRVITFYSYKGGTGRSMAVANVAWLLALSGERVLVVDWDLEAPGIHRYFHPLLEDKELLSTEGLLDFVEKLETRAAMSAEPLAEEEVDVIEYVKVLKWPANSSLKWEQFGENAGIDLLVAGRQGPGYSEKLNAFKWIEFYDKLGGRRLLRIAGKQMRSVYDYTLIDSRTGVSDTSGICTVEMPDTLVVCFTLNDQSIIGASGIAMSVLAQRQSQIQPNSMLETAHTAQPKPDELKIFPVPTRVEIGSERVKREVALTLAQRKFAPFLEKVSAEIGARYWGSVQLPYFAFYAFEEIPAVFGDQPHDELSLLAPMKHLARAITGDRSLELRPLHQNQSEAERLRKEVLGWYLRKPDGDALDPLALAQKTYSELDPPSQILMKKLLLRLVQVSGGSLPQPLTCAMDNLDKPLQELARKLLSSNFLQSSGDAIYIADRKVVENWDLLREWVKADEVFLMWRQGIAATAQSWRLAGHDPSGLLRGKLLDEALQWLETRSDDLNDAEREFLVASKNAMPAATWRLKWKIPTTTLRIEISPLGLVSVVVLLAVIVAFAWIQFSQK